MSVLQRSDWFQKPHVLHPVTVGAVAFACLYLYLRISSNRTLARDDVITWITSVAIGSTLSRIVTTPDIDLVRGLLSLFLFLSVNWVTTFVMSRSRRLQMIIRGPPALCVFRGKVMEEACLSNRIGRSILLTALRSHGLVTFDQVECMVLETTGAFSIITKQTLASQPEGSLLLCEGVPGYAIELERWKGDSRSSSSTPLSNA